MILWIAEYLKKAACKHDLVIEEDRFVLRGEYAKIIRAGVKVSLFCKKCGHHRCFWKFGK